MSISILTALILLTLTLAGCSTEEKEKKKTEVKLDAFDQCEEDEDCICGGVDERTGRCFLGNKLYYENYVDKSEQCPDFCGGPDGNMVVRCVDNRCVQMYECLVDGDCEEGQRCKNNRCYGKKTEEKGTGKTGCESDSDCIRGGCSGTVCQSKDEEPIMTTCEFRPEYECYEMIECSCVEGECQWEETGEFNQCVEEKKQGPE